MTGYLFHWLLLSFYIVNTIATETSEDVRAEVGTSTSLTCRVDTAQCGELHSVKWYRDNQRVYVFAHVANIRRPEGDGSDRMDVEYIPNSSESRLHIKNVEVTDEALYKCEKTYLEVRENCDVVQVIKLRTIVRPRSIRMVNVGDGSSIGNETVFGPYNEGTNIELECEVADVKPIPQITWYNGTNIMDGVYSSEEGDHGVGSARNKLRVQLQRGDLLAVYKCVVESDVLDEPIVSWLKTDVNLRPTKLELSGVKSHVVQGTNVLLRCNVVGARPAANVLWYNGTTLISRDMIETSAVLEDDGTYVTESELIFTATRFENGQSFSCKAENQVLKDRMEKPLEQKLILEVFYPPIVTIETENITVNETNEVFIKISYISNPAQLDSVKWYRNDQLITLEEDQYEGGTTENPSLRIKSATRDDAGEYHCELKNSVGAQDSWNSVVVNVLYKPLVELKMEPSNIVKALDRLNVTLFCDVISGNPDTLLRVQWYLDGSLLKELPDENCTNDVNSDRTFCDLDPSRLLLEYVAENFAGNYSCHGMNEAGWGPVSDETELIVYYPPSKAVVRYEPSRVVKKGPVTLYCSVENPGRPENISYKWLRGNHVMMDAADAKLSIPSVTFEPDINFTCIAYNKGGEGPPGTVHIQVLAPPAFINALQPYTGVLMNSKDIHISCRVECLPMCSVIWLKNGHRIGEHDSLYYVINTRFPTDLRTYDFESIQSILHWNMSAWPNEQLNRIYDNANYTCESSSNSVGPGVTSMTYFAVEYPPENITVTTKVVPVVENLIPQRVICNAKAHPEVSYTWYRDTTPSETIDKGNALMLGAVTRTAAGYYVCRAFNKHGNATVKTFLNVMYKPECVITQTEWNGNPALVCTAHANPREVTFTWRVKGMNETPEDMRSIEQHGLQSFLILDSSVDTFRTYVCYANNTVDISVPCERDVAGAIAWWKRFDNDNLLILIAIIVGVIVCVIVICIIIIIVCRRKRASNKYNNPVELEERENQYDLHTYNFRPDGQSPDSPAQSKWPLKPGVLVHVNRMHNLNMRNLSQLSRNHSSPDMEQTRILPKSNSKRRIDFGSGNKANHKRQSRIFKLKQFLGIGKQSNGLPIGVYRGANGVVTFKKVQTSTPIGIHPPATVSRKRKKPGLVPNPSNTTGKNGNTTGNASDAIADPENKTFYENLPFHGMQNPPNKPVSVITPFIQDTALQKSALNLNTSSKSLIHNSHNPVSSPVQLATKIQRNQSFHGFQTNGMNTLNFNNSLHPIYTGRSSNLISFSNRNINCMNLGQMRGPLILAPNSLKFQSSGNLAMQQRFRNPSLCSIRTPVVSSLPSIQKQNTQLHNSGKNLKMNEIKPKPSSETKPKLNRKKFNSFEYRKQKCSSPIFYSVRCRKHGQKRTIFEFYPLKHKCETRSNKMKTNANEDEIIYQNLTDSIQISEQNDGENRPKPAPRCKKSPNGIYQNIAFVLKVTPTPTPIAPPDKNSNESNETLEDKNDIIDDDINIQNLSTPSENITNVNVEPVCKPVEISTCDINAETRNKDADVVDGSKTNDRSTIGDQETINPNGSHLPIEPKTDLQNSTALKRPIPLKPADFSNPSFIPKMPILDTHNNKWTSKSLTHQNPFYTLTTPQLTSSSHHKQFINDHHLYSSTFPHQRHSTTSSNKLVPRSLFPLQQSQQQSLSKSKSFTTRTKQKKHFQIPLQKCHSFKFQTAESYFQPIKNIHEENLMKNGGSGGYKSDYGPHYGFRDEKHYKSRNVTTNRENLQFHESVQNSMQLQYPQPLYATGGGGGAPGNNSGASVKKNGVVYADLDMKSAGKLDKKHCCPNDLKRLHKANKTEYATLKFNDVGQEIDV